MNRFFAIALFLWSCSPILMDASPQDFKPLFDGTVIASEAHGVWESPGYGWIASVTESDISLYHYTEAGCLKDPASTEELAFLVKYFAREGSTLWLTARTQSATIYPFEQATTLPASCQTAIENTVRNVFEYFWSVMDRHYAFFDIYDVDWDARKAEYAAKVSDDMSEMALFELLGDMMEGLNDAHLELHAEIDGERQRFRASRTRVLGPVIDTAFANQKKYKERQEFVNKWFFGTLKNVKKKILKRSAKEAAGGTVVWGKIKNVGYLAIYGMQEFDDDNDGFDYQKAAVHRIMNEVVVDLADTDKMIVDVSLNQGGMDEISLALASHFTKEPVFAYTKVAHESNAAPQKFFVEPAESGHYTKPVTLLTSDVTVSAAEIFVIAMRALPNVNQMGDTTSGALSDILSKTLPNGWELQLSNEIYRDAEGTLWEGKGIPPDEYIQVYDAENMDKSVLEAIREVARRIQ